MRFLVRILALASLICGVTLTLSCGEKRPEPMVSLETNPVEPEPENKERDLKTAATVPETDRPFQLDSEEIRKLHSSYTFRELPDYVGDVWGAGYFPREDSRIAEWAFIVPQERIADFKNYLHELGVPDESFERDSAVVRGRDYEEYRIPVPPVTELEFRGALTAQISGKTMGLEFVAGRTRGYFFDNLNRANGNITIKFDDVTGNCMVLVSQSRN